MNRYLLLFTLMMLISVLASAQIVAIYCTYDDLEEARQSRIYGTGINQMLRNAGWSVTAKAYPNQSTANSLVTSSIQLVIGSSHGDANTFYDCQNWTAIWTSNSPSSYSKLKGKIVHLLACQNGKSLAPSMQRDGVLAILAYCENFQFSSSSSENNAIATADAEFDRTLATGGTTGQAYTNAYNKFMANAREANLTGDAQRYSNSYHNAKCMKLFGSQSSKLNKRQETEEIQETDVPELMKLDRPTDALLQKFPVAYNILQRVTLTFFEYLKAEKTRAIVYYKDLSEEEFKGLCIARYSMLDDSYKLGIRGFETSRLLDKNELIAEISDNTELGLSLVKSYRNLLDGIEEALK